MAPEPFGRKPERFELQNLSGLDNPLVATSLAVYRLLLAAYPARFRSEYGPWMAQAFRDQCLRAGRASGTAGLLRLWAATLHDWLKTVMEQQLMKEFAMTRSMFIRICGICLMLSAAAVALGLFATAFYSGTTNPNSYLYRPWDPWLNIGQLVAFPSFTLLAALGMTGMYARFGAASGRLGQSALAASVLGGIIAFAGFLPSALINDENELPIFWEAAIIGLLILFAGLAVFGLSALRKRTLSRWGWLPVATGGSFVVMILLSMGLTPVYPQTLAALLFGLTAFGLFLHGRLLLHHPHAEALAV